MVKLYYPPHTHPDRDDVVHAEAVAQGLVGPKCMIGGPALDIFRSHNPRDLCAVCEVANADRGDCGGRLRAQETSLAVSQPLDVDSRVRHSQAQTAEAYKLRHEKQGQALIELFRKAEGERQ